MALLQDVIFVTQVMWEKDVASRNFLAELMFWCLKVDFSVLGLLRLCHFSALIT